MQDDFSDLPSADPKVTEAFRMLLDRRLGDFKAYHKHLAATAKASKDHPPLVIGLGGKEPVALEVLKHTPASMIVASGTRGPDQSFHQSLADRFIHTQLEVSYVPLDFIDYGDFHYVSEADERKLPEWQKRRNKSAEAKQALIDKLKAKRRAR